MNQEQFEASVRKRMDACYGILNAKAHEYALDEDRLHNFTVAGDLQGVTPRQALGGMLAKHIVSIYDMINEDKLGLMHVWDEKLGDAINYLLLLNAMVEEEITADWAKQENPEDNS